MTSKIPVVVLAALIGSAACTPVQPTPPPSSNTASNTNTIVLVIGGPAGPTLPTPTSAAKPDIVKVTQFGETCPDGKQPSGQDRSVRVGCSKALTCSPKCKQTDGAYIDCPVPQGASPDEFRVFSGEDRISFTAAGENPAFNRDARGLAPGHALLDCTYANVKSEVFDLLVIP